MRTSLQTRRLVKALIWPLLIALGAGACCTCPEDGDSSASGGTTAQASASPNSLQEYEDSLVGLLASPCDEVPSPSFNEIHDCQRFITDTFRFGSLIGIFPDPEAMTLAADAFTTPTVAAYITNAGGNVHYPDTGYPFLNIGTNDDDTPEPSQYCLWLQAQDPDNPDGWRAAIVANTGYDVGGGEVGCREPPPQEEWTLKVTRRTKQNQNVTFGYPPTARWAWTAPNNPAGRHYIEIRCGEASCGITDQSVNLDADLPAGDPRRTIPGWFDAQFLAVFDDGGDFLVPGPWGAVYPVMPPGPHGLSPAGWRLSSRIEIMDDPGPYEHKFSLNGAGISRVFVNTSDFNPPLARYQNPDDPAEQVDVITGDGTGHGPHGSARWRWHDDDDEGPWSPCDEYGCCEPAGKT